MTQKNIIEIESEEQEPIVIGDTAQNDEDDEVEIIGEQRLEGEEEEQRKRRFEIEEQNMRNEQRRRQQQLLFNARNHIASTAIPIGSVIHNPFIIHSQVPIPSRVYSDDILDEEEDDEDNEEESEDEEYNNNHFVHIPFIRNHILSSFISHSQLRSQYRPRRVHEIPDWMKSPMKETKPNQEKKNENGLKCGICWDSTDDIVSTVCGHLFCRLCMRELFRDKTTINCPICRTVLTTKDVHRIFVSF